MRTRILYFLLSIGCLFLIYKTFKSNLTKVIKYPNFGIRIPAGYEIHGIDVSRYQSEIDWGQVVKMRDRGQKISFVIIKSTEGLRLKDPHFEYNWEKSKANKLIRGAYFYFRANCDAESQAQFYINNTKLTSGDLPPIIDIEDNFNLPPSKIRESLKKMH
ncbi:MAG: lysozyme [Bacteroidetes bacterium OLB11]|nr:MAG: lysozyme [Bacteroidetes bacterium OLB11]